MTFTETQNTKMRLT